MLPVTIGMVLASKLAVGLTRPLGTNFSIAFSLAGVAGALAMIAMFDTHTSSLQIAVALGTLGLGGWAWRCLPRPTRSWVPASTLGSDLLAPAPACSHSIPRPPRPGHTLGPGREDTATAHRWLQGRLPRAARTRRSVALTGHHLANRPRRSARWPGMTPKPRSTRRPLRDRGLRPELVVAGGRCVQRVELARGAARRVVGELGERGALDARDVHL